MLVRVMMAASAPRLMKYLSAALSSVWVSPGLISTGSTVSLLRYLALTFARTTERANRHHLLDYLLYNVTKRRQKQRGGSREQESEMKEEGKNNSAERRSLVMLHGVLNL